MALGLGTGSLIAAIALGVVLTYRGSGVVNFSKGAVAIFIGYMFHELRHATAASSSRRCPTRWRSSRASVNSSRDKADWLDLPNWPTVHRPARRAAAVRLGARSSLSCYAALLGLILHFLVFRPLRFAPPLAKVVASVGLFIVLPGHHPAPLRRHVQLCRSRSSQDKR